MFEALDAAKLQKLAAIIRYEDMFSVAIRIMKLPDGQVKHIEESHTKDQRRNYEILTLWKNLKGAKESDLCAVFCDARKEGIGVPEEVMRCLQASNAQSPGILN